MTARALRYADAGADDAVGDSAGRAYLVGLQALELAVARTCRAAWARQELNCCDWSTGRPLPKPNGLRCSAHALLEPGDAGMHVRNRLVALWRAYPLYEQRARRWPWVRG